MAWCCQLDVFMLIIATMTLIHAGSLDRSLAVLPAVPRQCNDPHVADAACFLPGQQWVPGADSTAAIRAALATNKSKVIIPRMPTPWIVSTAGSVPGAAGGYCPGSCHALHMQGQQNMTILVEDGAEIQAQRGDWHAPKMANLPLLMIEDCRNITIYGYGAKIVMWKIDYANASLYNHSEFRFGIAVYASANLRILGLNVSSTGGDGLYFEDVENVFVKDVSLFDNFRQGMSVISAENLTVEDSLLANTGGTWPMCGLDLEPDYPYQKFINITFRRVESRGNAGCGFSVAPAALNGRAQQISITFEDCIAEGNGESGYTFQGLNSRNITGFVKIVRGAVRHQASPGIIFFDKHPSVLVTLSQLAITDTTSDGPGEGDEPLYGWWLKAPVVLQSYPNQVHPWHKFAFGGVWFDELSVSYSRTNFSSRAAEWPWLRIYHIDCVEPKRLPSPGEANITGTVKLYTETPATSCPGVSIDAAGPKVNVSVAVACNPIN